MNALARELQCLYEEGKLDSEEFWTAVYRLAKMVFDRYYPGFYKMKEDLISNAVVYSVTRLRTGMYDSGIGILYNYMFTACRNSMSNEVQRQINFQKTKNTPEIYETCYMEPDYDALLDMVRDDPITARSNLYYFVERSPVMLDIRDLDDDVKELFITLIENKLTFPLPKQRNRNDVNLLLWLLFVYSGCEVKVPSTTRLSQILRQARIYIDYKSGMTVEEIARKYEIRKNHVERIIEDLKEITEENGECLQSKKKQRKQLLL